MMHTWTQDVIKCRCKTRICLESLYHYFTEQDCKHSSIPLQVYTLSVRGSHHPRPEASYYPCHRRQSAVAEPPRSSSPAQTHVRTLDSASSWCSPFYRSTCMHQKQLRLSDIHYSTNSRAVTWPYSDWVNNDSKSSLDSYFHCVYCFIFHCICSTFGCVFYVAVFCHNK